MPSRVHLAYVVGVIEGIAALALSLLFALAFPSGTAAYLAIASSIVYAVLAANVARKVLAYADFNQPYLLHVVVSWLSAAGLSILVAMAFSDLVLPQVVALWTWIIAMPIGLLALRFAIYRRLQVMFQNGQLQIERVALIGKSDALERFKRDYRLWQQGTQVTASLPLDASLADSAPDTDMLSAFARRCLSEQCNNVLFLGDLGDFAEIDALLKAFQPFSLNVMIYPESLTNGRPMGTYDVVPMGPINSFRIITAPIGVTGRILKRSFDIFVASVFLVLLSPFLLSVALAIRLTSPGPALYRQERRGFSGNTFQILKFRSMRVMEDGNKMSPAQRGDPRITPLGRFLRASSIDELPQLINVLKGDMSLVGPRPHAISHDTELSEKFELFARRQRIKPGITGWAQVNGYRGDISTLEKLEARTLHDLYYIENWSVLFDCWIILLTVFSSRARQNAL